MKITTPLPSADELRRMFSYVNGVLCFNRRRECPDWWNERFAGKPAGSKHSRGYIKITINYQIFLAHRIVFKMFHGFDPKQIDHINGKPSDNRIQNLRSVDSLQNSQNKRLSARNKTGVNGVCRDQKGRWRAHISVEGNHIDIGRFRTKEEAVKARQEADKKYNFHKNHGRKS